MYFVSFKVLFCIRILYSVFVSQEAEEGSNKASRGRDLSGRGAVEKPKESADHRIKKRCISPGFLRMMWSSSESSLPAH